MRIACWQATPGTAPHGWPARLRATVLRAREAGAGLLITPELSATGYPAHRTRARALAEPADGRLRDTVGALAAETGLAVLYGWPEWDGDRLYNAVHLVDGTGAVVLHYRKTHLYAALDAAVFDPGDRLVAQARIGGLTVGVLLCYDVEFPESVRAHALAGTQVLAVPTALAYPWQIVPRILVPARAFESQLVVAYVNWADDGRDGYCGLSRVAGADGGLLADAGAAESLLLADVDPAAIDAARQATGYLRDLRTDLYPPS